MNTKHLIAAAALAAIAAGVGAQQDTTRMDRSGSPGYDSGGTMRDQQRQMGEEHRGTSGIPAGGMDESQSDVTERGDVGVTQQPSADRSLSRSEVQHEAGETSQSNMDDSRFRNVYGGD